VAEIYRFRDKRLGDALPLLLAVVYFFVVGEVSGEPIGDYYIPIPMVLGWAFFALSVTYFALANYAIRREHPGDLNLSVPVVATLGAYAVTGVVLVCLSPYSGVALALGIVSGTIGMLGASQWHPEEEVTKIHLILGMIATLILFGILWGVVSFALGQPVQTTAPLVIAIALSMFFGTVIGDWMVSDHGTVGYFGGTDAIFYAFALTSIFVLVGFYAWSGGAISPLT
jgi:hypothetical protein